MSTFQNYLDPSLSLHHRLAMALDETSIDPSKWEKIMAFLGPIRVKDLATYEHSIRVGLLTRAIADFMHLDGKVGLYAGLLHDIGKAQTKLSTLQKTSGWTEEDAQEIAGHVYDSYRLIRGCFDFTAEVILWHHRFQPKPYPNRIPDPLHGYSEGTKIMIPFFGRILSLADVFDALHRVNDKHGDKLPTGEEIKANMLKWNPDQRTLVTDLFEAEIFTTKIFPEMAPVDVI